MKNALGALLALAALSAGGCCFGGTTDVSSEPFPAIPAPTTPALGATPPVAPPATTTTTLAPGFAPDPQTLTSVAGGSVAADTISPDCRGYVASSTQPNHVIELAAPFAALTITADAVADATMLVQRPDGTWLCNDDFLGLDPGVSGAFTAGTHRVWVGTYSSASAGSPYTLSISTVPPLGAP